MLPSPSWRRCCRSTSQPIASGSLSLYHRHYMASAKNTPDLKERIVSAAPVEDDSSFELKLRPQRLAEFIGQSKVKENLAVAIEAAKSRGEALDHVLLYGPPGLGKTTLGNHHRQRIGSAVPADIRADLADQGRSDRDPDQSARQASALYRRSAPPAAGARGDPLLGSRGLQARHHDRARPRRPARTPWT